MTFDANSSIQRKWRQLPNDAPREVWYDALREATRESYLSEPGNPYRESGRSRGSARWVETRGLLADGIDRDGHYMDVGCANGLLLESLADWASERGHRIVPHGIDLVPELVDLAMARHEEFRANFTTAKVCDWEPPRRYDWVRTNMEYVPPADRAAMVVRLLETAVAPGGVLILCHYRNEGEPVLDTSAFAQGLGLPVVRQGRAPGVDVSWIRH